METWAVVRELPADAVASSGLSIFSLNLSTVLNTAVKQYPAQVCRSA